MRGAYTPPLPQESQRFLDEIVLSENTQDSLALEGGGRMATNGDEYEMKTKMTMFRSV